MKHIPTFLRNMSTNGLHSETKLHQAKQSHQTANRRANREVSRTRNTWQQPVNTRMDVQSLFWTTADHPQRGKNEHHVVQPDRNYTEIDNGPEMDFGKGKQSTRQNNQSPEEKWSVREAHSESFLSTTNEIWNLSPTKRLKLLPDTITTRQGRTVQGHWCICPETQSYFIACGYKRQMVFKEIQRVLAFTQEECLNPTRVTKAIDRIPLVTTYNPYTTYF